MKLRRKAAAILLVGTIVASGETRRVSAQDSPPDLRMLMNLDLFEPRHNAAQGAAAPSDDSMLDQIRTLDEMGYLGDHPDAGEDDVPAPRAGFRGPPADAAAASDQAPAPAPASRPSIDVEGPQP